MRGKGDECEKYYAKLRITPAYAGKSAAGKLPLITKQDHPRLCGEKCRKVKSIFRRAGSPPPMRGKAFFRKTFFTRCRITPAYAGKSDILHHHTCVAGDHPRLCGEKDFNRIFNRRSQGSPPPMRGKASVVSLIFSKIRITPAYAGKSL